MKKTFAFLILVVLILPLSIMSAPSVKASTSEAIVISDSFYTAPANTATIASAVGDFVIVGEVQNVGTNTIGNITVQGSAYNSAGQTLATTGANAFVYDMTPGQKAPFYIDFTAQSSINGTLDWTSSVSTVSVTVTSVTDTTAQQYSGLIVPAGSSNPWLPGNGSYIIDGTIVNNGTQPAQDPWVVATFYNSAGTVVGLNFTDELTSSLPPGGAIQFFCTPSDDTPQLTSEIANYSLVIDSLTSLSSTAQNTPLPTEPPSKSTAQFPTLPIAGAVVVIVVVVIAALMLLRKRQKTTLPSPPPPPPPPPIP